MDESNYKKLQLALIESEQNGDSNVEFILKELSVLKEQITFLSNQNEILKSQIERSELFFSRSEVQLITKSKLPQVVIKASDVFPPGDNFYDAEPHGENDFIRWTGPKRLNEFSIPIDRSVERTLRIVLVSAIKEELYASIKLYIDGKIFSFDSEKYEGRVELFTSLPITDRVQDTQVSMFIPALYSPSEINPGSTDSRKLGVAFYQLEVV